MIPTESIALVVTLLMLVAGVSFWAGAMRRLRQAPVSMALTRREIDTLKAQVSTLLDDLVEERRKRLELERALAEERGKRMELENSLAEAQRRIQFLEMKLEGDGKLAGSSKQQSLLVGIGSDDALRIDLAALRKVKRETGMLFTRLMPMTKRNLEAALENRRARGNPFRYVHLSLHAGPEGVICADGLADGLWLSEHLQDVQVLVIAGCHGDEIGNLLGVVPFVVTMRENIEHKDAAIFTEVFWSQIGHGRNPEDAFYEALQRCPPAVAEFAELHV